MIFVELRGLNEKGLDDILVTRMDVMSEYKNLCNKYARNEPLSDIELLAWFNFGKRLTEIDKIMDSLNQSIIDTVWDMVKELED